MYSRGIVGVIIKQGQDKDRKKDDDSERQNKIMRR